MGREERVRRVERKGYIGRGGENRKDGNREKGTKSREERAGRRGGDGEMEEKSLEEWEGEGKETGRRSKRSKGWTRNSAWVEDGREKKLEGGEEGEKGEGGRRRS